MRLSLGAAGRLSGLTFTFGSAFTSGTRPPLGATKDL